MGILFVHFVGIVGASEWYAVQITALRMNSIYMFILVVAIAAAKIRMENTLTELKTKRRKTGRY